MDLGVLFTLPVESIAIRAIVATLACVALARLLLRAGLRVPSVRVATALAPAASLLLVVGLSWEALQLPALMLPVDAVDALPVPVRDGYLHFAPIAAPLLVGSWGLVAGTRLTRRGLRARRARGAAATARSASADTPRLTALAARLAEQLHLPAPEVRVVPTCAGGAFVAGMRRPVIVLDRRLVQRLDEAGLEGVVAHELAHVRRRDNLVSTLVGAVRDVTFFVPGGGWAVRQLHRERELAADQVAVTQTGRPGALASGLLKVLEDERYPAPACATLAPRGGLVGRVRVLVDDVPPASRRRRGGELAALALAVVGAVVAAVAVPTVLAGAEQQRDAVGVMWSSSGETLGGASPSTHEARAFDVYRGADLELDEPEVAVQDDLTDHGLADRRSTWRACSGDGAACPEPEAPGGLGLQPPPRITVDDALTSRWEATPLVAGGDGDGFGVYLFARVD